MKQPGTNRVKEKNTRICKLKTTSRFFQEAFDINFGINSTQ